MRERGVKRRATAGQLTLVEDVKKICPQDAKTPRGKKPRGVWYRPPKHQTEKQIMTRILAEIAAMGGTWIRRNTVGLARHIRSGNVVSVGLGRGSSDLVVVVAPYGRFVGLEVKTPRTRNDVSDAQREWLDELARLGAITAVVCSPEEARAVVERARRLP